MMYTYIMMRRTQIYLTENLTEALDRRAKATGLTRSQLIRDALNQTYLDHADGDRQRAALLATSGAWCDMRVDGEAWVDRVRHGRLAGLHERPETEDGR